MSVSVTAGARFYIGPVAVAENIEALDEAAALAYFEAIEENDWVEINEIESFGDLGDNTEVATFASVKDRRVRKFKTTRDAGSLAIVCGRDPSDEGQIAMIAAEKTDYDYAFRLIYNDKAEDDHSPSTEYFAGMVLSATTNIGGVGDITKITFGLGVNTAIAADPTDPTGS